MLINLSEVSFWLVLLATNILVNLEMPTLGEFLDAVVLQNNGAPMEFVSIDVETANADMSSICQIGAARFVDGAIVEEWKTYVDPEDYFDGVNVSVHGIDEVIVQGAPTFDQVAATLNQFLTGYVVVCHTHFDRVALHQAAARHQVVPPSCTWLDSARVARRAWSEFASRGYSLLNVCKTIGYEFVHHDALEDAKAAGNVLLAAMAHSGLDLEAWLHRVRQPIASSNSGSSSAIKREGKSEGPLYGEVLVFTGALETPRREAADLAANVGCRVMPNVTQKTTLLVVGDQDILRLAGHTKSSKHRKAEDLISKGYPIRILRESDCRELVDLSD